METEERLHYQINGRGFIVCPEFSQETIGLVGALVDQQLFGSSTTEVIERAVLQRYRE